MKTEDIIRHYMYVANFKNQGELADYLGIHRKQISYWKEHGSIPKKHLARLIKHFGHFEDVLTAKNDEKTDYIYALRVNSSTKEIHSTSEGIKLTLRATSMIAYRDALLEELWSVQANLKRQFGPDIHLTTEQVEHVLSTSPSEVKKLSSF